ncbi:hypothetical protein [Actinacidiphila acididurans]|uniref:Glycosyltransferase RgtA/B/C/D-like domain-containing protein n=1 Tax=Actinacidiphila acididurans TaxID=2784346 RepID=A0ABS2U1E3_9ACTN|nr:hypothetical protein [Actinacidiphila acididurans]MBM9508867.1 hypothetical protein [Actinacidiphila acididurans]
MPQLTTGPLTADDDGAGAARDALIVRAGRYRPTPYLILGTAFWLVVGITAWRAPIQGDFGQHASAVQRIKDDWLHPMNPLLKVSGANSPYFSPYIVALGLFAKLTGLAAWRVVKLSLWLNLAVLLLGVWAFTRTLSTRRWAPVFALAAFTLVWGVRGKEWSGFCGLWSLTHGAPYPSCFAVGVTLLLWAWADRLARRDSVVLHDRPGALFREYAPYVGLGAAGGVLLLIHPITALAAWVGLACVVAGRQHGWSWPVAGRWAAACTAALVVALVWPYNDIFSLAGDTTVDAVHRRLYADLWHWYGLAFALGLPVLALRARRYRRDPLVLMFLADCALVGYGWVSGHYTYGRVFALLVVPLQFGLAVEVAQIPPWTRVRRVLAPLAVIAVLVGTAAQIGAVVPQRYLPVTLRHPRGWPSYGWVADHVPDGDVLIADGYFAPHTLPAYGIFMVNPTWPDPSTSPAERNRRFFAARAYLDPHTPPDVRARIGRRYDIRWLLLRRGQHVPYDGRLVASNPATGERLIRLADG